MAETEIHPDPNFERLGLFYLGTTLNPQTRQRTNSPLLYDSRDLITHAVCVGMTGSGKTGLCTALIEEAAIDGVPAIVIDPKGDLGNLLLTFPDLRPSDFEPWVDPEAARRKGMSREALAEAEAARWRAGLIESGQSGERIRRLRDAAEFAIYTPGSSSGIPVSVLRSFAAPGEAIRSDAELMHERIATTVAGVLGLVGIDADPIRSRQHILLSTLLERVWREGRDTDLLSLIQQVQTPPVERIGALDVDSFFPQNERFELAMSLNGLVAAPRFAVWTEGAPLDLQQLLYTREGRPRIAVFSIAHLSDTERMFFVSLLLNETLAWTRSQSGTTSLRALVYMDEIFGYLPPTASPPSKLALLTMMKQARAFGVGVVLATQNPVDLDYKALSNAGTWFVGRLQTERDQLRVLDAIEGAAAAAGAPLERAELEQTLAALQHRVFLMHDVHERGPVLFESRWALSYLRGPMTRNELRTLMDPLRSAQAPSQPPAAAPGPRVDVSPPTALQGAASGGFAETASAPATRWSMPADVPQFYAPPGESGVFRPMLLGVARVRFTDAKLAVDETRDTAFVAPFGGGAVGTDWSDAVEAPFTIEQLSREPSEGATFETPPPEAQRAKNYQQWTRSFVGFLLRQQKLTLFRNPAPRLVSSPGESEADFRIRVQQATRERRDQHIEQLRHKYAPKAAALEERLRRARQGLEREEQQVSQSGVQSAISFGATLVGAVLGRKVLSGSTLGRATTAARGAGRVLKEKQDVSRAQASVAAAEAQKEALEAKLAEEVAAIDTTHDLSHRPLETITVAPKRTGIEVRAVGLVWVAVR